MQVTRDNIDILTVGFRYEKTFRISDILGHIFDTVLHDKSSPFGTEFFPRYQEMDTQDRMLFNGDRGYYLRITTSDVIFRYTITAKNGDRNKSIEWFQNDASRFIIDKIIEENSIKNISRVGFMITHIVSEKNIGGKVLSRLTENKVKDADQFTLTFGNKDVSVDSLIKKGVNDYVNKITSMKQIGEEKYDVSFDYQYYFIPELTKIKEWPIDRFFERAFYNLDNTFYALVNLLLSEMVKIS